MLYYNHREHLILILEATEMKKHIRWFDRKNGQFIVRKFNGIIDSETADTISFMYNKRIITLNKSECVVL